MNNRTAEIATSGIAMVSQLPMPIPDNGLQADYTVVTVRRIPSTIGLPSNSWASCFIRSNANVYCVPCQL